MRRAAVLIVPALRAGERLSAQEAPVPDAMPYDVPTGRAGASPITLW